MATVNGSISIGRGKFTVSRETTFVTQPLDNDGYPDYVTALNDRLRDGVTPDNNACVLLCAALGSDKEGNSLDALQMLGINGRCEDDARFVSLTDFAEKHLGIEPGSEKALEIMRESDTARKQPWTRGDYPHRAEWLQVNAKPLAILMEASKRSGYYCPLVPTDAKKGLTTAPICLPWSMMNIRGAAVAFSARAMLAVGDGRLDEAWGDLRAGHRLARFIGRGGSMIEVLVSNAVEAIVNRTSAALLEFAKAAPKQLEQWTEDLRQLPPRASVADTIDLGERFFMLEALMLVDRHGMRVLKPTAPEGLEFWGVPNFFGHIDDAAANGVNWDPALQSANGWFDRLAAGSRLPNRAQRQEVFAEFERELQQVKDDINNKKDPADFASLSPDAKGKFIVDRLMTLVTPSVLAVQRSADRTEQTLINLETAFALARYHADHGAYAEDLDALVPKYLAGIPNDVFSGKPLIYKPNADGYLLYSVGPNGIDDGGRGIGDDPVSDDPPGDDIAIRMPSEK